MKNIIFLLFAFTMLLIGCSGIVEIPINEDVPENEEVIERELKGRPVSTRELFSGNEEVIERELKGRLVSTGELFSGNEEKLYYNKETKSVGSPFNEEEVEKEDNNRLLTKRLYSTNQEDLYYDKETKIVYYYDNISVQNNASRTEGYSFMSPYYSENGKLTRYDVDSATIIELD